jgi:hypothetical protein
MNESNHNEQSVNLKVSTAALLRNKFLAFGKNAVDRLPVSLRTFSPFPAKPRTFQPIAKPHEAGLLITDVLRLLSEQRLLNNADYAVFYAEAWQLPHLMEEIGRLREERFRKYSNLRIQGSCLQDWPVSLSVLFNI